MQHCGNPAHSVFSLWVVSARTGRSLGGVFLLPSIFFSHPLVPRSLSPSTLPSVPAPGSRAGPSGERGRRSRWAERRVLRAPWGCCIFFFGGIYQAALKEQSPE